MAGALTLGIVGVGNLGGALAEGALAAGAVRKVIGSDVSTERLAEASRHVWVPGSRKRLRSCLQPRPTSSSWLSSLILFPQS